MANNKYLVPASLLAEGESDSFAALVKQHKALAKEPHAPKSKEQSSQKSLALSQLVKAFKPDGSSKKSAPAKSSPGKGKSDSGLKKAAAALSKPDDSKIKPQGGGGHRSAGPDDVSRPAKPSAKARAAAGPASSLPAFKDPHTDVEHPTGKYEAFHHDTPSLKERTRPNVIPFDERHQDFHDRFHSEGAKLEKMKYLGTSSGHVFHGKMDDGTEYIAKPHKHPWAERGRDDGIQPERWAGKHNAVSRILSHMGADHMISPAVDTKGHASDMMPSDHPSSEHSGNRSAHSHAGQNSFATEFIQGAADGKDGKAISHKVDQEHRLMGLVTHMVSVNSDGHPGNIMVNKEHGHPVLIDNDLTMSLGMRRGGVRSHFLPGGAYDYTMGDRNHTVGKNYPPRVQKTLDWLAGGGHRHKEMGLGLHDDDADAVQMMAKNMTKHGLEGAVRELRKKGMKFYVDSHWDEATMNQEKSSDSRSGMSSDE